MGNILTLPYEPPTSTGKGGFRLLPIGDYELRCTAHEHKPAKSEGKYPSLKLSFDILATSHGANVGQKATLFFSLSPKAIAYGLQPCRPWPPASERLLLPVCNASPPQSPR